MELFHEFVSDADRVEIVQHPGWPLVTGIIALIKGEGRVSRVDRVVSADGSCLKEHKVAITTPYAVNLFRITLPNINSGYEDNYYIERVSDSIHSKNFIELLSSKHWKYLLRTITQPSKSASTNRRAKRGMQSLNGGVYRLIDAAQSWHRNFTTGLLDKLIADSRTGLSVQISSLTTSLQKYLLDTFVEPDKRFNTPTALKEELSTKIAEANKVDEQRHVWASKLNTALGNNKWVVIVSPSGFVSVGKVDCSSCLKSDFMSGYDVLIPRSSIEVVQEFKLYKSLTEIDPQIKDELLARLTMDKAYITNSKPKPALGNFGLSSTDPARLFDQEDDIDPLRLIPSYDYCDSDIGYIAYSAVSRASSTMYVMLDA